MNSFRELHYRITLKSLQNVQTHFKLAQLFCNVAFVHSWPADKFRIITSSYKTKQKQILSKFTLMARFLKNMHKVILGFTLEIFDFTVYSTS
jgi:hypothetical protein